ncbi:MAG: AAA domain-containing protein, partial [Candidatus Promineifilaceae bacterium]
MRTQKVIQYWLTSLIDAELVSLDLDRHPNQQVSLQILETGRLPTPAVEELFPDSNHSKDKTNGLTIGQSSGLGQEAKEKIPVVVAPFLLLPARHSRGRMLYNREIYPLLIPAELNNDGSLIFNDDLSQPWIPRKLLGPTSNDLVLGELTSMETFLLSDQLSLSEDLSENWSKVLSFSLRMLEAVSGGEWRAVVQEAGYQLQQNARVVNIEKISGMATNIIRVYDRLLAKKDHPILLRTFANELTNPSQKAIEPNRWVSLANSHLGSFQVKFPMAPSQRKALLHALSTRHGEILAISGPPGTGKTTLLHSIIGSLWVQAALYKVDPPIIVVASTNNQAVTNVIDSLHKFEAIDRWLPVTSFGLFLVNSKAKQEMADDKGLLYVDKYGSGFPSGIENKSTIIEYQKLYLERCSEYFGRQIYKVIVAVNKLHEELVSQVNTLKKGLSIAFTYKKQKDLVGDFELFAKRIENLRRDLKVKEENQQEVKQLRLAWIDHCQQEPIYIGLLSFLPVIARKRQYRTQQFLISYLPDEDLEPDIDVVETAIEGRFNSCRQDVQRVYGQLQKFEESKQALLALQDKWTAWCRKYGATDLKLSKLTELETVDGEIERGCLLNWLDNNLRYELLLLAVHYWEGRWLMEAAKIEQKGGDFVRQGDRRSQEA